MPLAHVWTYWGLNWFFLPNCLNFQQQNPRKNQYLPHLSSENCEINSIKFDLPRAFQQHQESTQNPIHFSISILVNFYWKIDSIINSFHTIAPKSLKPSDAHLLIYSFPKIPRAQHEAPWFWKISTWQNKTNYLAS